jgi:uncharacterized lipoprotein YajG
MRTLYILLAIYGLIFLIPACQNSQKISTVSNKRTSVLRNSDGEKTITCSVDAIRSRQHDTAVGSFCLYKRGSRDPWKSLDSDHPYSF